MKQVIIVRNDLKLPKGKLAAQVAHASVTAVMNSEKKIVEEWKNEGMAKIVIKTEDEKSLLKLRNEAKNMGLRIGLITDAGKTVVSPGTITCLGIGPDDDKKIDVLTKNLKLV